MSKTCPMFLLRDPRLAGCKIKLDGQHQSIGLRDLETLMFILVLFFAVGTGAGSEEHLALSSVMFRDVQA